jgi:hypothetical protein
MKKAVRQLTRYSNILLVAMLVFASIVPGALHAAVMAAPVAGVGSGHHAAQPSASGLSASEHQHAGHVHATDAQEPLPAGHGTTPEQCCPMSCSFALNPVEPLWDVVFLAESFEITRLLGFVVTAMALPERPPRA